MRAALYPLLKLSFKRSCRILPGARGARRTLSLGERGRGAAGLLCEPRGGAAGGAAPGQLLLRVNHERLGVCFDLPSDDLEHAIDDRARDACSGDAARAAAPAVVAAISGRGCVSGAKAPRWAQERDRVDVHSPGVAAVRCLHVRVDCRSHAARLTRRRGEAPDAARRGRE